MEAKIQRSSLLSVMMTRKLMTASLPKCLEVLIREAENQINEQLSETARESLRCELQNFIKLANFRWRRVSRMEVVFMAKYGHFYDGHISIQLTPRAEQDTASSNSRPPSRGGRPSGSSMSFNDMSSRTRRRHSSALAGQHETPLLATAAAKRARTEGLNDLGHVLQNCTASPARAGKMRRAFAARPKPTRCVTPVKALAMMVAAGLTVHGYNVVRNVVRDAGVNILPSYKKIMDARRACYPDNIEIAGSKAKVPLQDLLNHTTHRLAQAHLSSADEASPSTWEELPVLPAASGVPGPPAASGVPGPPAASADPGPPAASSVPGPPAASADPGPPAVRRPWASSSLRRPWTSSSSAEPPAVRRPWASSLQQQRPASLGLQQRPPTPDLQPRTSSSVRRPWPPAASADPGPPAASGVPGPPAASADPGPPAASADPGPPAASGVPGPPAASADPGPPAASGVPGPPAASADPGPPAASGVPGPPAASGVPGPPAASGVPGPPAASGCLISKWGFDGASNQSCYKQKLPAGAAGASDQALLSTFLVPLQLEVEGNIVWRNDRPSSTTLCRPVHLEYIKETADVSRAEYQAVEEEIAHLQVTEVSTGQGEVHVTHKLLPTMMDGKAVCALTNTRSPATCTTCGATPSQMNRLDVSRAVKPESYLFGLSPLHARIRCFELVLHLAYRLEIKQRNVTAKLKPAVMMRKQAIQQQFRQRLGLIVDYPIPGGQGNTNDGNTSRRAFEVPQVLAEITGVSPDLIKRLAVILTAINSTRKEIDPDKFGQYALETARFYVELYNWYAMPPSVHKLLVHGADIIRSLPLPVGMLSEEAQEKRNKESRNIRERNARKTGREDTMEDQTHQLLVTSDPLIANIIRKDILRVRRQSEVRTRPSSHDISHLYKTNMSAYYNGNNEVQDGEENRSEGNESEDNGGEDGGSEGNGSEEEYDTD